MFYKIDVFLLPMLSFHDKFLGDAFTFFSIINYTIICNLFFFLFQS